MRSFLYWLPRLMGDANVLQKGKIGKRIGRRLTGRWSEGRYGGSLAKEALSFQRIEIPHREP